MSDVDHDEEDLQAALAQSVTDLQPPPPPPPSAQVQNTTSKPKKGKTRVAPESTSSEASGRTLDPRLLTQLNDSWLATHSRCEVLKTDFQQCTEAKKAHEQRLKDHFLVNYWDQVCLLLVCLKVAHNLTQNDANPISVTVYKCSTVCSLAKHPDTLQALSVDLGPVDYYDLKL